MTSRKQPVIARSVEEWDRWQPIIGADLRTCDRCGEQTRIRGRQQPKLGRCLPCQKWMGVTPEVADELHDRALDLIIEVLGPCEIGTRAREERQRNEPQWMLCRGYWFIARRWEQKWVWCTPKDAEYLMRKWWEK
jgi:hypothetical protein